ncbi:MAG: MATE family efflux transporter [Bacillota bacterium]
MLLSAETALPLPEAPVAPQPLPTPAETRAQIIQLSWPAIVELALQTLTQIVDMAMVGRLGAAAIASIGLSFQPLFLAMGLFMGLSVGTTALVARHTGAKEPDRANHVTAQSTLLAVVMALVFAVVATAYAPQLITFMGAQPEVVSLGVGYMRYLIPGMSIMLVGMIISGALRGAGDTRTPMKINAFCNIANILLNYCLIFGHFGFPRMEVQGAALATSLSRALYVVVLIYLVIRPKSIIHLQLDNFRRVDFPVLMRTLRIGVPAALERLTMSLGLMAYVRIVAGMGTTVYAAHSLAINAEQISFMPGMGFATAATALVGQNLGAKRPDIARRAGWETFRLGAILMGAMGILFLTIPELFLRIYTNDPDIIAHGATCLRIMGGMQIPMAAGFILPGALRGAGDTRSVLLLSMFSIWLVRLGLARLFVIDFGWGLPGAWYAMAADWLIRGTGSGLLFHLGRWERIKV